jgi:release factor glutamine methyltransferase
MEGLDNANTVFEVLKRAKDALKGNGLAEYDIDCELLLSSVLGIKRGKLPFIRDQELTETEMEKFGQFVLRRSKREPVTYIIGSQEFMGLDFNIDKSVLIPRQETEILVQKVIEIAGKNGSKSLLDLCCGSGIIAISCAKFGNFQTIVASDISPDALKCAKSNADLHNLGEIKFINSDLFEDLDKAKFDIIASNPPYIGKQERVKLMPELSFEPDIALFCDDDGLFFYKNIAKSAGKFLNKGGQMVIELNSLMSEQIKQLFIEQGYKDLEIIKDYAGLDRVLWIR